MKVTTISVSEARAALPQLLDRVGTGEEVTITRHGKPVAVLVRPDTLRARRADDALAAAEAIRVTLARARRTAVAESPMISKARAKALLAEVAAGRSRR